MNPQSIFSTLSLQGNQAYQAGLDGAAAALFSQGAALAKEQNNICAFVHNLRWTGNSLMWGNRHDEATHHLLHAISFDGHAEADPDDVYGAITDVCLMATRLRPYSQIRQMLTEARAFLAARNLEHWDHRLDLIECITQVLRGQWAEAHQLSHRAWQRSRQAGDGPHYDNNSYLNYIFRSALGTGEVARVEAALQLFLAVGKTGSRSGVFRRALNQALRLACEGVSPTNRESLEILTNEAIATLKYVFLTGNETMDALRLHAMLGRWDDALARLEKLQAPAGAETALLRLDLEICRLAKLANWQPQFYQRNPAAPSAPLLDFTPESNRSTSTILLQSADEFAALEDVRMECTCNREAVALRRHWLLGNPTTSR